MNRRPEQLYLDLMKKTLSFSLWPEPPSPVTAFDYLDSPIKRYLVSSISRILWRKRLQIVRRRERQIWPGYADTMIGLRRLDNLQYSIETALAEGVEGDLIETGVWRGGACIFMRAVLAAYGIGDRRVFVADSFEGLPKPDVEKYPADKGDTHFIYKQLAVSREEVENNFRRYGLLDDQVVFLEGWFKDTLPKAPIAKLSVLRLDGDMYGSTMESLENLYPRLSRAGFCIIDDYDYPACKAAVNDFRSAHEIDSEVKDIDGSAVYWRKG